MGDEWVPLDFHESPTGGSLLGNVESVLFSLSTVLSKKFLVSKMQRCKATILLLYFCLNQSYHEDQKVYTLSPYGLDLVALENCLMYIYNCKK